MQVSSKQDFQPWKADWGCAEGLQGNPSPERAAGVQWTERIDYVEHIQCHFVESKVLCNDLLPGSLALLARKFSEPANDHFCLCGWGTRLQRHVLLVFSSYGQDLSDLHPVLFFKGNLDSFIYPFTYSSIHSANIYWAPTMCQALF